MGESIKRIVILGGGTAGWMTASYLAKSLEGTASITVLEAPGIPRIGVGEATIPNLQPVFFNHLGIDEDDWMRECGATFKLAVKFINWKTPGPGSTQPRHWRGKPDIFYHPFGILPAHDNIPITHLWFNQFFHGETEQALDYSCFVEPPLMDARLSPRFADGRPATRYAWHFDANLVADFLRRFATEKLGVAHVRDLMVTARQDERGFITALETKSGGHLEGELFIDCSGFRGALINGVMDEPFLDQGDHLLCDSAVACPVPYEGADDGMDQFTSAIAVESGWVWRTPLMSRFGTGYVYSSAFVDRDQATLDFCNMWGLDPEGTFNQIRFRVGRNRRSWVRNCVSIGLSSCFLEPLESSGLYFTYAALYQLVRHFPDNGFDEILIDRFNTAIADMYDDTRDFIQVHFALSPREDTPFWRANHNLQLSDSMREKVRMYKAGLPVNQPTTDENSYYTNFDAEFRNFWTNGSYYCIFTGLGVVPDHPLPTLRHKRDSVVVAQQMMADVSGRQKQLMAELPSAREYLSRLHAQ
ncbi:MAG TPA: tryptophan halogenase family protein [Streptosporangiaceae bacterium]|nr:tryptophan halogenase family protein [Streptosporangiaceae bacterium]